MPTGRSSNPVLSRYILIAGAPKSATSSLFAYLSDHPDICPAARKETYFFAREFDYRQVGCPGERFADFERYFTHCDSYGSGWRLEATPYTLYADGAARKIAAVLPEVMLIFILRDPVQRFLSDYRFHLQREHPAVGGSLETFVHSLVSDPEDSMNLLELGCYARYLRNFLEVFEPARIRVILFEELKDSPRPVMQSICDHLRIDQNFYDRYSFVVHNPTLAVRSAVLNRIAIGLEPLFKSARARIVRFPRLAGSFEHGIRFGKGVYHRLNDRGSGLDGPAPDDVTGRLADYYRPCNQELSELIGRPLPWSR